MSDLNMSYLREYITLAKTLNFTRAASLLNTTQTTLSKHLATIEQELGCELVRRTTARVELTRAGKTFLEETHIVVKAYDAALERTRDVSKKIERIISLGGQYHYGLVVLFTHMYDSYRKRGEQLEIVQSAKTYPSFSEMLADSQHDALIVSRAVGQDWQDWILLPLFSDRLLAVMPAEHPLASKEHLAFCDFANERIMVIAGGERYENQQRIEQLCKVKGISPITELRLVTTVDDFMFMDAYNIINFIPAYMLQYYPMLKDSSFCCRIVEDDDCTYDYWIAYRKSDQGSYVELFAQELANIPVPENLYPVQSSE